MITVSGELWILLLAAFVLGSAIAYLLHRARNKHPRSPGEN